MMSYAEQLDAFGASQETPGCRVSQLRAAAVIEGIFGGISQDEADAYASAAAHSPGYILIIEEQLRQQGLARTAGLRSAY